MDGQNLRIEYMIKALGAREVDPGNPIDDRSTAYWNIAYVAEFETGNFSLAREFYRRLIDEYPPGYPCFRRSKGVGADGCHRSGGAGGERPNPRQP